MTANSGAVFLDANVLLEILLARAKEPAARKILEVNSGNLHISALTAHLVTHFGRHIVDLPVLRQFLGDYTILGLEAADFEWAFTSSRGHDFEDALQLAVAIRNGCGTFITFDKNLYKLYKDLEILNLQLVG